jgi:hypothetical protein
MNRSESIAQLAQAMSLAQAKFHAAVKGSKNPFFNSKYADLNSIIAACRPALSQHDLSFVQIPSFTEGRVNIETVLMHKSGEWISGELSLRPGKDDAQSLGSCISYNRRYSLQSMLGLGVGNDEDDDGNLATRDPDQKKSALTTYSATETDKQRLAATLKAAGIKEDKWKLIHELMMGKPWEDLSDIIVDAKQEQDNEATP